MHKYLTELNKAFCGFFLNNKLREARIRTPADLDPARRLYEFLR